MRLYLFLALILFSSIAYADGPEALNAHKYFDLPVNSLGDSIVEFALQADISISVKYDALTNLKSANVKGRLTINEALTQLLNGTSIGFHYIENAKTIVLDLPDEIGIAQASTANSMDEIEIVGLRKYPFRYNTISHSEGCGLSLRYEDSRFINIIPQNLMNDNVTTDISQVLKYASGVTPGDGIANSNDDIFIRGFQRHAVYLDGFRLSEQTGIKLLPFNLEKLEIIKGPATLYFGQAEPGGIVNAIRKHPEDADFLKIEVGSGSLGKKNLNLDNNHQFETVNTRLVFADFAQAYSVDLTQIHKMLVAPSVTWKFSDTADISASYEFQDSSQRWNYNQQSFSVFNEVGPSSGTGPTRDIARPDFESRFQLANLEWKQEINADWQLKASYFHQQENRSGIRTTTEDLVNTSALLNYNDLGGNYLSLSSGHELLVPLVVRAQNQLAMYPASEIKHLFDEQAQDDANQVALTANGTLRNHRLEIGANWHGQNTYSKYVFDTRNSLAKQIWSQIQQNGILGIIAGVFDLSASKPNYEKQEQVLNYDDYGVYVADTMDLGEKFKATLGTRYNVISGEYANTQKPTPTALTPYKRFTSQAGLTYKMTDEHSLFFSYSEAIRANYRFDDVGHSSTLPELSHQYEAGIKSLAFDGALITSLAAYNILKNNITDIKHPSAGQAVVVRQDIETTGVEMDASWRASTLMDLTASLSIANPAIKTGEYAGNLPTLATRRSASLFAHYTLPANFDISLGTNYVDQRFGDDANLYVLPCYNTWDLTLGYRFPLFDHNATAKLNFKNLTNKKYYTALIGGIRNNQAEGASAMGSVDIQF